MKKSIFLIWVISILLVSACSNGKQQSLEEFYKDAKIENIDKIIIQDGSTGYSKTITNQEQIDEFLSLIQNIEFSSQSNQEQREGWRYGIVLFDNEQKFQFTLSQIGDTYYDSNPDIYPIVDNYYKQLEIEEK